MEKPSLPSTSSSKYTPYDELFIETTRNRLVVDDNRIIGVDNSVFTGSSFFSLPSPPLQTNELICQRQK